MKTFRIFGAALSLLLFWPALVVGFLCKMLSFWFFGGARLAEMFDEFCADFSK
jgi:hypothetical protein